MKTNSQWPKKTTKWIINNTLYMSIPFTWLLPKAIEYISQIHARYEKIIVGGPAVYLLPLFFKKIQKVTIEYHYPGVLQKVNPNASRTTVGCPNKCKFCGVSKIEPEFKELEDWPDHAILCDNNILAASESHFDKVCDRLEQHGWCDFNQGIDLRLLTPYHAERFKRIGKPILRLAMDHPNMRDQWVVAYETLRAAKLAKNRIRSYCLIGFNDTPEIAWQNCKFVESFKVRALPMWFHPLDAMIKNGVTKEQKKNGWNDYERRKIMQWYYQHKKAVKNPQTDMLAKD